MKLKLTPLSAIIMALFATNYSVASVVRADIPYQTYRDFGENKGQFVPNATNLPIFDKKGNLVGTLDKAPMIDFSAVSTNGVGTLTNPQYAGSVKHNSGYSSLHFGGSGNNPDYLRHTYLMVDRNNHNSLDYHIPRYHKYITESAPVNIIPNLTREDYVNRNRFQVLYRTGSGTQSIRDADWKYTYLSAPYNYLTGGTVSALHRVAYQQEVRSYSGALYNLVDSPLTSYADQGDSGSPLFAYDLKTNQWILVGFQMGGWGRQATAENKATQETNWVIYQTDFTQNLYDEDTDPAVKNTGDLILSNNNDGKTATFTQNQDNKWTLHVKDTTVDQNYEKGYNAAMNAGKNITLNGNGGNITLTSDINQGAGGLTFNNNYTVKPEDNQSWQGAGVIVNDNNTLTWEINGIANDFLHKLGNGTMLVKGKGKNPGSLSAGDGTTLLDQKADEKGEVQAFNIVKISSGRPTVVLNDEKQVKPDNIYFGYRGGRLDVNGNNLEFALIHNVDNGAQIVNHNQDKASTISVKGITDTPLYSWENSGRGTVGTLYKYSHRGRIDYFILKTGNYGYFPTDSTSNNEWEFVGNDENKAKEIVLGRQNKNLFAGIIGETNAEKHNGKLNFTYKAPVNEGIYTLAGGSAVNGEIKAEKGVLLLSGSPTPHANNTVIDDDWITRNFIATQFTATNGATLQLGNYAHLEGNIKAESNSKINLGYSKGDNGWDNSWQCILNDGNGTVSCNQNALSDMLYQKLPQAQVTGDITLAENAVLNLGKTNFTGKIQGQKNSKTRVRRDTSWTMSGDSTLGDLTTDDGSIVKLNGDPTKGNFNTLTINGDLNGNGRFELNATVADKLSDRIIVNGKATGNYLLALQDSGKEPIQNINLLPLLTLNHIDQDWSKINATLPNGHVDFGAYRYTLTHKDNSFALYTALLPDNPIKPEAEEPIKPAEPIMPEPANPETQPKEPTTPVEPEKPTEPVTPIAPSKPITPIIQKEWISQNANTALSDQVARINLLNKQQDLLNHYLRRLNVENSGIWLNIDREGMRYGSDDYRTYKQELFTQQIGADSVIRLNNSNLLFGAAFTHTHSTNRFAENQSGSTKNHATGIYAKWILENQFYLNGSLNYHHLSTTISGKKQKIPQNALTSSIGIGQHYQFGSFSIRPAIELSYYRINGVDYALNNSQIHQPTLNFWQARSGMMLDKIFASAQGTVKIYTALYYVSNIHRHQKTYVNSRALSDTLFTKRIESQIGAIFGLGKNVNISLKAGYTHGNQVNSQFNGGIELKYHW
ncbi:hypothetical protein A1D23_07595 [Chelonobacter oris]|uniref:S6 family peptidase n=1 Tax=Chelonobacter oris TaxID=505317 RepID=UPI002447B6C7|nr:S6 family peptidase [Chelonobacter oris]MDH2999950.1 hypothetical protein [Chelonobacter oris]